MGFTNPVLTPEKISEARIQDPASSRADIMLPEAALDSARKTFGTDEDLLFVRMRRALAEGAESAVLQAL